MAAMVRLVIELEKEEYEKILAANEYVRKYHATTLFGKDINLANDPAYASDAYLHPVKIISVEDV